MDTNEVEVLKDLIETTTDSADGYSEAASESSAARFRALFASRAAERRELVRQLKDELQRHGATADTGGSVLAAAHRRFLELRRALARGDDAVLEEVERGEDYLRGRYERALRGDDLSGDTRGVILRAYEAVRTANDQVHALRRPDPG